MTWVTTFALVGLLVPNLVKLLSVSAQLLRGMPAYFKWVREDQSALQDEETRASLERSFTIIFSSVQTHAANAVVCGLLGWILWHRRLLTFWPWLKVLVTGLCIAGGVGNIIFARHLTKGFFEIQRGGRAIRELQHIFTSAVDPAVRARWAAERVSFTMGGMVTMWGWIGFYLVSALACGALAYLLWS